MSQLETWFERVCGFCSDCKLATVASVSDRTKPKLIDLDRRLAKAIEDLVVLTTKVEEDRSSCGLGVEGQQAVCKIKDDNVRDVMAEESELDHDKLNKKVAQWKKDVEEGKKDQEVSGHDV